VNPGGVPAWSFDVLGLFPNTIILTGRGISVSIVMWPHAPDRTFFDIRVYMKPVQNMAQRVCREAIITMTRDVMREDFDHVEPQQSALSPDAITHFQLSDQELAVRHGYAVLRQVIERGFPGEVAAWAP
jgi:glycine betaine catabolism A